MANRKVVWDIAALYHFRKSMAYIAKDSLQNAAKVQFEILEKTGDLPTHPEVHPFDKYKLDNDGNYRAFELHHYRIAYYIFPHEIRILRFRHTAREPESY
jgi:plasmid stabilization system protein ParE